MKKETLNYTAPYLIQRGAFEKRENKKGIDAIVRFDYMGASEFEWGALPTALKTLRSLINNFVYFDITLKEGKIVTIFCNKTDKEQTIEFVKLIAEGKIQLKCHCDLKSWVNTGGFTKNYNDFYWDIVNNYMFWKKNDEFTEQFKKQINEK